MAKLLQIAQLGNSILRRKAVRVADIRTHEIQVLIDSLIATLNKVNGVGIAAPQVYESRRIFIIYSHPNPRYPRAPKFGPVAIINPKIVSHSRHRAKDWEGCLSVPGVRVLISRYKSVTVEYLTRDGKNKRVRFRDFIARIFQHEYDHLKGLVFLDRVSSNKDIVTEKEYQRIVVKN